MSTMIERMEDKEVEELKKKKYEFNWSIDCLQFVSLNDFVHFYVNLPKDVFVYDF